MAYPTLAQIKTRLGIADASSDAFLTMALSAARGAVENYCGYRWEYPDSETREFELWDTVKRSSVFDISDPGLLSLSLVRGRMRYEEAEDVPERLYVLRRKSIRGTGPYDKIEIRGVYDFAEITGVFGRGLTAPDEVSECVMLLAMNVYSQGAGLGLAGAEVDNSVFQDDLINFLLRGHRRYR